jgi:anti-sigma regulatory factor (Ser/Thr protein kinase)
MISRNGQWGDPRLDGSRFYRRVWLGIHRFEKPMSVLLRQDRGEDRPPALSRSYAAIPDSVPLARRTLVGLAAALGADEEQLESIALAVSEALTNCVVHAYPGHAGRIHVSAWVSDFDLSIRICDEGPGFEADSDTPGLGVGLGLIARLADQFEIAQPASGGTEVKMSFWLPDAAQAG